MGSATRSMSLIALGLVLGTLMTLALTNEFQPSPPTNDCPPGMQRGRLKSEGGQYDMVTFCVEAR